MVERVLMIGSDEGLKIIFEPLPAPPKYSSGLAWGKLELSVAGTKVWAQAEDGEDEEPVFWTWVDLLEGIGRIWPWLTLEENYPIPILPEHPGGIDDEAGYRWRNLSEHLIEAEEDLLFDFKHRHNLSLLLRGITLPSLWILREGNEFVIWSEALSEPIRQPFSAILSDLEKLCDFIYESLNDSEESRAILARRRWEERKPESMTRIEIRTGMSKDEIASLVDSNNEEDILKFFDCDPANDAIYDDSEIFAAARMTAGAVEVSVQKLIMESVREVTHRETSKLDALSKIATSHALEILESYKQGYQLANWLREELDLEQGPVDPVSILESWDVEIIRREINCEIDAIAVWGTRHGPGVILNIGSGSRASTEKGLRATLAHEICHLLYDRGRSLPVVDVLGGFGPRLPEKRANAFSAELLLPRKFAESCCLESDDILKAANSLEARYQVSREIVRNQIMNSDYGSTIDRDTEVKLRRWMNFRC